MILKAEDVSFGYPGAKEFLQGISLSLHKGDVMCLLGPNGAGKTTFLRCLLGINKFKQGKIYVEGRDIREITAKELARKIAYVPQANALVFPYKVLDMVIMGRSPYLNLMSTPSADDRCIAQAALEKLGISHLENRLFSEISGGERQMVLIARALTQQSDLLVMDEPAASLDYGNQARILQMIRGLTQQNYSIIMSSHFPSHVFLIGNKVAFMKNGKILAFGKPDDIVNDKNLSDLYDAKIRVITTDIQDERSRKIKVCVPMLD